MRRCLLFLYLTFTVCFDANTQTIVGPSVVKASPVLEIVKEGCTASVAVRDPTYFKIADRVLIHQVKGALLGVSIADEGVPTALGSTGSFEFGTVSDVVGSIVHLSTPLLREYDITGFVQLVQVISGSNLVIEGPITCKSWDGICGGIVVIESQDSVLLRCNIDVSGDGFVGGAVSDYYNSCLLKTEMNVPFPSNYYGQKGEGVAEVSVDRLSGRAATGNGGGGGANHNAGGGGGSNGGSGGGGGAVYDVCGIQPYGGLGGVALIQVGANPKLFFGGGGGGGHQNENHGSTGGDGGGCIVISTPLLSTNGSSKTLSVKGTNAGNTSHDGAGGGGAGGTVFLDCINTNGNLVVDISGGLGGNLETNVLGPHGPGGGGGGGQLLTKAAVIPSAVSVNKNGGPNGVNKRYTSGEFRDWYAQPGHEGVVIANCIFNKPAGSSPPLMNHMVLRGSARYEGSTLLLTDTLTYSAGAAWFKGKVKVASGFDTQFTFKLSSGTDNMQFDGGSEGADGVVFVLQNLSFAPLGLPGQGLGYEDTPHGLAVEFDSYRNGACGDPSGSHVAVQLGDGFKLNPYHNAPYLKAITSDSVPSFVADGSAYYARIAYSGGILNVYISKTENYGAPVITLPIDINKELNLGTTGTAYFGFTSATGFSTERHEITSWSVAGCDAVVTNVDEQVYLIDAQAPFTVQPSPARDAAQLVMGEGVTSGVVQIVDVNGAIVWTTSFGNNTDVSLPVERLASGMYAVRVVSGHDAWTQMWSVVR